MQKLVNVLAIASTVVSASVVGGGLYVYLNRASIIDGVKSQVMESVTGSLGGLGSLGAGGAGGAAGIGAGTLPLGTNDLSPDAPQADPKAPQALKPF
tara:strand:- start:720 stop:1010 length:291 start_codon:yes stop_codon:yes gene_type:complete